MALNSDHKDVNETALKHHNKLRALHRVPNLTLDWDLAKSAQEYADKLAKTNSFSHSKSEGKYGENLASSFNSKPGYVFGGDAATQNWYDEIKDYKFNEETQQTGKIGHFSQVVWKDTKLCGFGRAKSANGNFIIVGQYKPPGNFLGKFKENILSPTGAPPKLTETPKASPPAATAKTTEKAKTPTASKTTEKAKTPTASKTTEKAKTPTASKTTPVSKSTNQKSKDDKLIKKSTKTSTVNGKVTVENIETFMRPDGTTYEVSKITN